MGMKHAFNRDLSSLINGLLESLQVVEREGGSGYIKEAFTYNPCVIATCVSATSL